MNFTTRLATGLTTGAVLMSMLATSTFAAGNVNVKNNKRNSVNSAVSNQNYNAALAQANVQLATVGILNNNSTGGNKANDNQGAGGTSLTSGPAGSVSNVLVGGNANTAKMPTVAGLPGDVDITGNGRGSVNIATLNYNNNMSVSQSNVSTVMVSVTSNNSTGGNTANDNSGAGGTTVQSGAAGSVTNVTVGGSSNTLQ